MINKIDNILDYYKGNLAYTYFLLDLAYGSTDKSSFILEKKNINAAIIGCISNILLAIKEDLVQREEDDIVPKILLKELEKSVDQIATKKEYGYEINNYVFKDAPSVVAEIRNKIAHGAFTLDLEHNRVILNMADSNVIINIDKLSTFIIMGLKSYLTNQPKKENDSVYERNLVVLNKVDAKREKKINDKKELLPLMKKIRSLNIVLESTDGSKIPDWLIGKLEIAIKEYSISNDNNSLLNFEKELSSNYKISIKRNKISNDILDKVADGILNMAPEDIDYNSQMYLIGLELQRNMEEDYETLKPIVSNLNNLIMLKTIKKYGTTDIEVLKDKIIKEYDMIYINYDSLASSSIAMFNSLFSYARDDVYKNSNKFTLTENNGLDYGKLDLKEFDILELNIDNSRYLELVSQVNKSIKELDENNKKLADLNESKKIVEEKGNTTASEKIKASINLLTNKQSLLLAKVTSKQNELKTFIDYCKNNSDYLRNECIIEGIRNSISHGNYRVKAESSLEECKIIFEDIYEGELTFKAQIKLLDFITLLVNNHNIISNFVDNKSKKLSLKS